MYLDAIISPSRRHGHYKCTSRLNMTAACRAARLLSRTFANNADYSLTIQMRQASTMKAWQVHNFGGFDKLQFSENVPIGTIKSPNEILVEVHAASVNPLDVDMLGGYGSSTLSRFQQINSSSKRLADLPQSIGKACFMSEKDKFPITLGRDFSGVVVDTGQQASKYYKPGDEVWGVVNPLESNKGSHGEFSVVTTSDLSLKPKNLNHREAAALPFILCTTWSALTVFGNIRENRARGKRILILGGSGGIGTLAIQLLKQWGAAEITTTCATDALDTVLTLGADVALDYKTHNVLTELEQIKGFDLILDCVRTNQNQVSDYMQLLKANSFAHYVTLNSPMMKNNEEIGFPFGFAKSLLVDFGPTALSYVKEGKHYRWAFYMPNKHALKTVAQLVEEEKIQAVIDEVFPFQEIPAAFEKVSKRQNRGKNVIDIKQCNEFNEDS